MRNVFKKCIIAAVLLAAAGISGVWCGAKPEAVKDSGEVTVTDLAGRQVTLKLPVKRVNVNWTGSGGAFMTMSALLGMEVADYFSSWDGGLQNSRFDMWEEYRSKIPALEQIPIVGDVGYDDFNLEKMIQLNPDVVIWTLGVREQAKEIAEPALAAAGIPIVYIDYHAETIENHTKTTRLLGRLFGKEARAEEILKFYMDNMNMINERLAKTNTKPLVYVEITMPGPEVYGNTYGNVMWGPMIKNAGGNNLAEGIITNWGPVSAEIVISKNPDVIILTGAYWPNNPESVRMGYLSNESDTLKQISAYLNRPGWKQLNAVKNKRFFAIYQGLGREIYDVVSLAFLAKCIHPDLFTDVDPMAMLQEYYNKFLPYDLYGVWMTHLE
jgi:iron complex transport system substrate-binding protein